MLAAHRTTPPPGLLDEIRRLHQPGVFKQLLEFPAHGVERYVAIMFSARRVRDWEQPVVWVRAKD